MPTWLPFGQIKFINIAFQTSIKKCRGRGRLTIGMNRFDTGPKTIAQHIMDADARALNVSQVISSYHGDWLIISILGFIWRGIYVEWPPWNNYRESEGWGPVNIIVGGGFGQSWLSTTVCSWFVTGLYHSCNIRDVTNIFGLISTNKKMSVSFFDNV